MTAEHEQILSGIATIRDDSYYWGKVPLVMRAALEGSRDDESQAICLARIEENFLVDRCRIETFCKYKDAIPFLGTSRPWWLKLMEVSLEPTSTKAARTSVEKAIEKMVETYKQMLRSPMPRNIEPRERLRSRTTPPNGTALAAKRKREKSEKDRSIRLSMQATGGRNH